MSTHTGTDAYRRGQGESARMRREASIERITMALAAHPAGTTCATLVRKTGLSATTLHRHLAKMVHAGTVHASKHPIMTNTPVYRLVDPT
jgi:hypothetical protein